MAIVRKGERVYYRSNTLGGASRSGGIARWPQGKRQVSAAEAPARSEGDQVTQEGFDSHLPIALAMVFLRAFFV